MIKIIKGHSMYPLLAPHDILFLNTKKKFRNGDIVLAKIGKNKICHRVVNIIDRKNFVLKGDQNCLFDKIIDKKDILGVVTKTNFIDFNKPFFRFLSVFLAYLSYTQGKLSSKFKNKKIQKSFFYIFRLFFLPLILIRTILE